MEQRERDKKSRQIMSQELGQDPKEEMPLFNAPIRVPHSDERLHRQLGNFEMAKPLFDKYIGVGPNPLRPLMLPSSSSSSSASAPSANSSSWQGQPYAHGNPTGLGGGYSNNNNNIHNSSGGGGGYTNSRNHMMGSGMNNMGVSSINSSSSSSGFLKPKEAQPLNGMSRFVGSSQQQQNSHSGHNRHDVSGNVWPCSLVLCRYLLDLDLLT